MRNIKSWSYFEQMKGCGSRVIDSGSLKSVTPDAACKTRFVIVDAVGLCKQGKRSSHAKRASLLHHAELHPQQPCEARIVDKWGDWAYSSYHWYLQNKGRDWLVDFWQEYPVLNCGDQ